MPQGLRPRADRSRGPPPIPACGEPWARRPRRRHTSRPLQMLHPGVVKARGPRPVANRLSFGPCAVVMLLRRAAAKAGAPTDPRAPFASRTPEPGVFPPFLRHFTLPGCQRHANGALYFTQWELWVLGAEKASKVVDAHKGWPRRLQRSSDAGPNRPLPSPVSDADGALLSSGISGHPLLSRKTRGARRQRRSILLPRQPGTEPETRRPPEKWQCRHS